MAGMVRNNGRKIILQPKTKKKSPIFFHGSTLSKIGFEWGSVRWMFLPDVERPGEALYPLLHLIPPFHHFIPLPLLSHLLSYKICVR
jgi:hypothetical protein